MVDNALPDPEHVGRGRMRIGLNMLWDNPMEVLGLEDDENDEE